MHTVKNLKVYEFENSDSLQFKTAGELGSTFYDTTEY